MKAIRNILFDLGGVIINLDIPASSRQFEALGARDFSASFTQFQQTDTFDLFDKGLISPAEFRKEVNAALKLDLNDQDFDSAWNAMLLDFPEQRLSLLAGLKPKYRTFLLSNTNEIHVEAFEARLLKTRGLPNLDALFEKTYYSCRMGLRKPDRAIFERVLAENRLLAEETLFIDDSPQHVEGARQAGIHAFLLEKNKEVEALLRELKLL